MIIIKDIINKTSQFINHEGRFANVTAMVSAQRPEGGLIIAVGESSLGDDRESCTLVVIQINGKSRKWHIMDQKIKGTIK